MKFLFTLLITIVLISSCKKNESNVPVEIPTAVSLVFPDNASECTTGIDINDDTSEVEFRWSASENTDRYELIVRNLDSGVSQDFPGLRTTSQVVPIAKGARFSWEVISSNTGALVKGESPTWTFYNAGANTSYIPFPAEAVSPLPGNSVFMDDNEEVELSWLSTDLDNDIVGYELYVDTVSPPEILIGETNGETTVRKVAVLSSTIYYWRVITKDHAGNTSESGIYDFRVY